MSDVIISVEKLSKRYRLGQIGATTLRDSVERWWHRVRGRDPDEHMGEVGQAAIPRDAGFRPWRASSGGGALPASVKNSGGFTEGNEGNKERGGESSADSDTPALPHSDTSELWALKDVSFEVKRGEVLGIIGRNGAGKSTLLKILSRITEPTSGRAILRGRVGSLLEVGTGFHPELSGRDNIYLNGAILGMKRAEITRKFDEIVAFAEIERFIDTPVKRYSSGMYVRLAFAVAAHLDPEILLVDEVLAVGDSAFQKKCIGKIGKVAKEGRTVVFVSHNMIAVRNLCGRAHWIQNGTIIHSGDALEVVESYLQEVLRADALSELPMLIRALPVDPVFRLESATIRQDGVETTTVLNGKAVHIEIRYTVLAPVVGLRVYFDLLDEDGTILLRTFHDDDEDSMSNVQPGKYVSVASIPAPLLAPRTYEVRIRSTIHNVRSCTGEGLGIPLVVCASSAVNRGYPSDTIRSRLQPRIPWYTQNTISE